LVDLVLVGWWVGVAQIIDDLTHQRSQTKTSGTKTAFFLGLLGHEVNRSHVYEISYVLISTILYWWKRLDRETCYFVCILFW